MTKHKPRFELQVRGDFIDGTFRLPVEVNTEWQVCAPGDSCDEVARIRSSYSSIGDAVSAARKAFASWKRLSEAGRADYLKKYRVVLEKRREEVVEMMSREAGKPLWESEQELASMLCQIDVAIAESVRFVPSFEVETEFENSRGVCRYRPVGVLCVVGAFSSPGSTSNGHFMPALLAGNTVIFKPSEKTPMTGQLIAECMQEAGLPPGVFNLVQGERELSRRLCIHEGVDGVLFSGSNETGTRIKQDTLQQHWKLLVLEMGGKNSAIVWNDADVDFAIHEIVVGGFVTAGQRCTSTSRVIVHQSLVPQFLEKLHERAKKFSIGNPLENPFMGPLIDQAAVDRYMKFVGIAAREGAEMVMRGKMLELSFQGNYVAPSICWIKDSSIGAARKSVFQQTELLSPALGVIAVEDIEHAIELSNCSQYGLVASLFSRNKAIFEKCREDLQSGLVYWNEATTRVSEHLPFLGLKKSGNHRPGGASARQYCSFPVASLEREEVSSWKVEQTGLNWQK